MSVESKDKNDLKLQTRKLQIRSSGTKLSSKTVSDNTNLTWHIQTLHYVVFPLFSI